DFAGVDLSHLRLRDDVADPVDRRLCRGSVDGGDLDCAVVFDIDLGAGDLDDFADDFPAGADHLADLVLRDVDDGNSRRVATYRGAAGVDRLCHFVEDVHPPFAGLGQRLAHNLVGDRGDLDIHLQRSH